MVEVGCREEYSNDLKEHQVTERREWHAGFSAFEHVVDGLELASKYGCSMGRHLLGDVE